MDVMKFQLAMYMSMKKWEGCGSAWGIF